MKFLTLEYAPKHKDNTFFICVSLETHITSTLVCYCRTIECTLLIALTDLTLGYCTYCRADGKSHTHVAVMICVINFFDFLSFFILTSWTSASYAGEKNIMFQGSKTPKK